MDELYNTNFQSNIGFCKKLFVKTLFTDTILLK